MAVFDTNIITKYMKGDPHAIEIINHYSSGNAAITFVNEYELMRYYSQSKNRALFMSMLQNFTIYQSTDSAAEIASKIYNQLKGMGKLISDTDILIAAICLANNETLVTFDKGFKNIQNENIIVLDLTSSDIH